MWTMKAGILLSSGIRILEVLSTPCLKYCPFKVSWKKQSEASETTHRFWKTWLLVLVVLDSHDDYFQVFFTAPSVDFRQLLSNTGAIFVHVSKQTWLAWLGKARWCPPVLLMLASWLESNMMLVAPARGNIGAAQGRGIQRDPKGSEGILGYRNSSFILYSRVIEQSMLKPSGKRAGIQVFPSQQSATYWQCCELWFLFLLFGPQHQLCCWTACMFSERQRKTCCLLFSSDPLIFSDRKNCPASLWQHLTCKWC